MRRSFRFLALPAVLMVFLLGGCVYRGGGWGHHGYNNSSYNGHYNNSGHYNDGHYNRGYQGSAYHSGYQNYQNDNHRPGYGN